MFGYRKNIVMVDNRCVIVTGASLLNAFERMEVLEYSAASLLAAYALGRPMALTEAEIQHTNQVLGL
jgi:L-fuculose-phosphate aldolase